MFKIWASKKINCSFMKTDKTYSSCVVVITAAGRGARMNSSVPKQYLKIAGVPILRYTILAFLEHKKVDDIVVVISEEDVELYKEATQGLDLLEPVIGGKTRQESVMRGLESIKYLSPDKVLIHDAVRPFVSKKIISNIIDKLDHSSAVVPAIQIDDTIKKYTNNSKLLWTIDRSDLWRAQTPQGFLYNEIMKYHEIYKDIPFTDDSAIGERAGMTVAIVPGSQYNFKITTQDDYERAKETLVFRDASVKVKKEVRFGIGYDIHIFAEPEGKKPGLKNRQASDATTTIRIAGVDIEFNKRIEAHSDGDVAIHSLMDALLGAVGADDIGTHFPDSDHKFRNIDSRILLKHVMAIVSKAGAKIVNCDLTIVCEKPKLGNYREKMRESLAEILKIDKSRINIKAKTNEKLDAIGAGKAIACHAIAGVELDCYEKEE